MNDLEFYSNGSLANNIFRIQDEILLAAVVQDQQEMICFTGRQLSWDQVIALIAVVCFSCQFISLRTTHLNLQNFNLRPGIYQYFTSLGLLLGVSPYFLRVVVWFSLHVLNDEPSNFSLGLSLSIKTLSILFRNTFYTIQKHFLTLSQDLSSKY